MPTTSTENGAGPMDPNMRESVDPPGPTIEDVLELEEEEEEVEALLRLQEAQSKNKPWWQFGANNNSPPLVRPLGEILRGVKTPSTITTTYTKLLTRKESKVGMALLGLVVLVVLALFTDEAEEVGTLNGSSTAKQPTLHTTSTFGGIYNVGQPGGAKYAAALGVQDIVVPVSNVGHAIKSLDERNLRNLWGHYVHDEHRSPYASHLYDKSKEVLDDQQKQYMEKMEKVRQKWGAWNMKDPAGPKFARTVANFNQYDYKDIPRDEFPPDAWQSDPEYLDLFFQEGRSLIERMQEGIYAEYGSPLKQPDGSNLTQTQLEEREEAWKIHIYNTTEDVPNKGIAKLSQGAWKGLVRKLLHGMITHDEFYVVLAGHSAAAGHGNDFLQNRILTFHKIMEPIFSKLGMRLISRNMGMGGVGTLHFSMGGGDLYGEADIMVWDSGMTEKGPPVDFFNKQAILSGERVPIIITDAHFEVMKETNGTAWMGQYINDNSMIPETTVENQESIPYAARWLDGKNEKYNAICWEPRKDFTPKLEQHEHPGSQVSWHPGNRNHQWHGRKLALIVLKALKEAFDIWQDKIADEGAPLPEAYWHMGDQYKTIRQNLRTYITTPSSDTDDIRSACEQMLPWMPRVCRVQMHGFGMWQPRAHKDFDLFNIIQTAPNGYKPHWNPDNQNIYHGFDLLPLAQAVPDGEVDVHAIAIATWNPAPDLDHSWTEDDETTSPGTPPTRRWLRQATESALGKDRAMDKVAATTAAAKTQTTTSAAARQPPRQLNVSSSTGIVPGRGWMFHQYQQATKGFCDGSAQSECHREQGNDCLMYGANDEHLDVTGNALSGWLVFDVPNVREGIILIRMEWFCSGQNSLTVDWTEENGGMTEDTTPWNGTLRALEEDRPHQGRLLGKAKKEDVVPKDLEMDIAINGDIKTMKYDEWLGYTGEPSKNCAVWPLLNDESMAEKDWDGEPVEVAVRFRSKEKPQEPVCISHLYYA